VSNIRICQHCGHADEKSSRELKNERKAAKLDSLLAAAKLRATQLGDIAPGSNRSPELQYICTGLNQAIADAEKP